MKRGAKKMSMPLPNRIPLKVLIRESRRLFLIFLFGTILITSLQDFSFKTLGQRALTLGLLYTVLFLINTLLLYYFDQKRKSDTENIWKKTFLVGYFCSFLVFFLNNRILEWLERLGYTDIAPDRPDLGGWKLLAFLLFATLVVYSFIFMIQNSALQQFEKSRIQMELLELKASNSEAVNQLLRQQIQPHFLFNALNILKSLIKKNPQRAEDYLLHLSDFLRLSISQNTSGVEEIAEELKICNDYMEMQRIRFGEALQYKVEILPDDAILKKKLPFFSLQPLLENAIKHNELTKERPLYIKIEHKDSFIKVSNNLQAKSRVETSTGNGLSMLRKRYKILNDVPPVIRTDGRIYSVNLKILDREHPYH